MRKILTLTSLVFAGATTAHAALITRTLVIPPTQTDWQMSVTLPGFDPQLGTLTGATLAATVNVHSDFSASTPGPDMITLTAGPAVVTVGPFLTLATTEVSRQALGPLSGASLPPADDVKTASAILVPDPAPLTLVLAATSRSSFVSDSGNGSGVVLTAASLDISLTYEYVPTQEGLPGPGTVPEPASLVLMGLGMLGILVRRAWIA